MKTRRAPIPQENDKDLFPSISLVISLYIIAAIVSLLMAFNPALDALHSANCLMICWFLVLGALGMGAVSEVDSEEEDDEFY